MSLNETFSQYWKFFWHSRTIRIATQSTKSKMIKSSSLPKKSKIEILQLEVKSVVMEVVELLKIQSCQSY